MLLVDNFTCNRMYVSHYNSLQRYNSMLAILAVFRKVIIMYV